MIWERGVDGISENRSFRFIRVPYPSPADFVSCQRMPAKQLLRIKQIIPETPSAKSFVLEPANGEPVTHVSGQFLTFLFTRSNGDEERRNYSISSLPSDEHLQITVKRVPNGEYSRWLIDRAQVGDELFTTGVSGFFTLPESVEPYGTFVFFAAGSGITPVYALIRDLLAHHPGKHIVLVYSNRDVSDTIFYERLLALSKGSGGRFVIEFLWSSSNDVERKRLGIYVLERLLTKYLAGKLGSSLFYLCGPFEYMRMITIVLRNQGVPAERIRKEIFLIEKPVAKQLPPDTDEHLVRITLDGRSWELPCRYPQTILQAARERNIPLPFSCAAGQCGTCAATCVSGAVWMWHNDVLLDEETRKGRVLTCTGYPIRGDVELHYP